ncbi:protease inhibitor I42 family protein [Clostridium algoriphilum]|uniref:protease inhibitor I42 family protein n=1 Tax=Clostridium algoriphilum TaxID=198347 RepID=UPI001CF486A7|nr:protease inhibitor I42 family protein [Clostridium algoriphilum]MCB2294648.1 protease inhibitor I42 family protein [Clostridium algoriphilum]
MTDEYENSKLNATVLSHDFINVMTLQEHMLIELDESPSTGYCWYYNISDPSILDLDFKKIFDFNKPNIIGGSKQIIWRFKCLKHGECRIQFAYYKSWKRENCSLDEYTYIIKVE